MNDPRDIFDRMAGVAGKVSLLMQLSDKVAEANRVGTPECGNCYWWMKSHDCPREHNVNGQSRGPSMSDPPCRKYRVETHVLDLKSRRQQEAVDFATKHGLPVPTFALPQTVAQGGE